MFETVLMFMCIALAAINVGLSIALIVRRPPAPVNDPVVLVDSLTQGLVEELHTISKSGGGKVHIHDIEKVVKSRRRNLGG